MGQLEERCRVVIPMRAGKVMAEFISFSDKEIDGITVQSEISEKEHIAIYFEGEQKKEGSVPLVRMHSECLTGDVFASGRCDCGSQLDEAIDKISQEGGYILYLRQEGRGIGLYAKLDAYKLQDQGYDTYQANEMLHLPADGRDFGVAAEMLRALGAEKIRLFTNNPDKVKQLEQNGIVVTESVSTGVYVNDLNRHYLKAKVNKKLHNLDVEKLNF